jgi:hypothetical protein
MVFHESCTSRLCSRVATRSHLIAVRLSDLITAIHKRTHPIALSTLSGDLWFTASFCTGSVSIEYQRHGFSRSLVAI